MRADAAPAGPPITAALGSWIAELDAGDVPSVIRDHLKLCLLDTLGCGLFGALQPWGRITASVASESAQGDCRLWGFGETSGAVAAALANGTAVHGFELDDVHLSGQIHPGSVTVPAALALGEMTGATGAELLTALAAGYETGIRLGVAAGRGHGLSGFHPTGTLGAVAAAASAARLLGLDADAATATLALGATQASGLYAARTGGMAKRFHAGHAASAGVTAGLLARRGFTGARTAIEEPFGGLLATMGCDGDRGALLADLGETWLSGGVGFKIYSTCASAQTVVEGVRQLRASGVTADALETLEVHMGSIAVSNVGWRYRPNDVVAAQMNGRYAAAVALLDGDAFVEQFAPDRLADPAILALTERVQFAVDPHIESGGLGLRHASRLVARLRDGTTRTVYNAQRPGGPGNEIAPEAVVAKFRRLARPAIGEAGAERLLDLVMEIDSLSTLSPLASALARPELHEVASQRSLP
ncbi:2-methylcitrate dehydratase PrpD [Devosia enhydra]|uniref:2-methylcitrate dehydratase PrpD n=1 Tax=Devosia enhydra TaxID=665118 RepID=A0A1K2HVN4_9HYPH|nr:MmgE/PrpD family protein [Devosia enhydra]SFZ82499.1 2-methylcitrate dehydratase PrpD [Devosia enhydra]